MPNDYVTHRSQDGKSMPPVVEAEDRVVGAIAKSGVATVRSQTNRVEAPAVDSLYIDQLTKMIERELKRQSLQVALGKSHALHLQNRVFFDLD